MTAAGTCRGETGQGMQKRLVNRAFMLYDDRHQAVNQGIERGL
jgi:hypothetical protein